MKHSRHVVEPNGPALAGLIERLKSCSAGATDFGVRVFWSGTGSRFM
jgi:hypothetical protein